MSTSSELGPVSRGHGPVPRLAVRTVALDPNVLQTTAAPGPDGPSSAPDLRRVLTVLAESLAARMMLDAPSPSSAFATWWRDGEGLVARGEAVRLATPTSARRTTAERWDALVAGCEVTDDVGLPGTGPVAFGSFAFDDASAHGGALVVPTVLLGHRDGRTWLTTAVPLDRREDGMLAEEVLRTEASHALAVCARWDDAPPYGSAGSVVEDVPRDDWREVVRAALAAIDAGEAEKVVAARALTARTERAIDPAWLVDRLAPAYPECWTFSVDGLVGATPELLVRLCGSDVTSRVLAGTLPRTVDDGDLAGAHLFASAKDRAEHEFAVASVVASLRAVCDEVTSPRQPFPLVLPNVVHLASDVRGTLGSRWSGTERSSAALRVAATMHPTAAVCGTPTDAATAVIRRIEGMDRGRYAGPVGWLDARGDGEWGIALRSAELDPADATRIRIFAGCGIVAGSDPDAELRESEAKLVPLREALGIGA